MKSRGWLLGVLAAGATGWVIGAAGLPRAGAQARAEEPASRYQISSWALPPTEGETYRRIGCFMVDTRTGELWEFTRSGDDREWTKMADGPAR